MILLSKEDGGVWCGCVVVCVCGCCVCDVWMDVGCVWMGVGCGVDGCRVCVWMGVVCVCVWV